MPYGYRRGGPFRPYGNYDRYMLDYWEVRRGYGPEGDYGRSAGDYGGEPRGGQPRRGEPRSGRERDIPQLTGSGQEAWDRERDEQDYRDYGFTHGYWPRDYREGYGYSRGYRIGHGREGYEGEEPGHRGRGPRGYARSDERIREDVSDRLMEDPYVDASDIEVRVSGREVTLDGTVDSRHDKRRAEDIAESVAGVAHVQNNLRVRRWEQGWP